MLRRELLKGMAGLLFAMNIPVTIYASQKKTDLSEIIATSINERSEDFARNIIKNNAFLTRLSDVQQ